MKQKKSRLSSKILGLKSRVINTGAITNSQVQAYKKMAIEKASKEISKIEEEIKQLEQNKI